MARKTIMISDLDGSPIEDGRGAKVKITYADARSGVVELDVNGTEVELEPLLIKGRKVARRGRKPSIG